MAGPMQTIVVAYDDPTTETLERMIIREECFAFPRPRLVPLRAPKAK